MNHTHYLLASGEITDIDYPACMLALNSGGRFPIEGTFCRAERDQLAAVLVNGPTAEVLLSDRPILVDDFPWGYRIQEMNPSRRHIMSKAIEYAGAWEHGGRARVTRNGLPLDPGPSQKIRNHSPDGFSWGYGGSGPAQLALALLLDVTGNRELAESLYQDFKWEVVAMWDQKDGWTITSAQIHDWLAKKREGVA